MNHTSNTGNTTRLNPFMVFRAGAMPHPPIGRRSVFVRTHRGTQPSHSTPTYQRTSFGFHYLPIHSHSSSGTTHRSAIPSLAVAYLQWEHSHGVFAPQGFAQPRNHACYRSGSTRGIECSNLASNLPLTGLWTPSNQRTISIIELICKDKKYIIITIHY